MRKKEKMQIKRNGRSLKKRKRRRNKKAESVGLCASQGYAYQSLKTYGSRGTEDNHKALNILSSLE
jgi:hypothetical protein